MAQIQVRKPTSVLDRDVAILTADFLNKKSYSKSDDSVDEILSPGIQFASSVTLTAGEQYSYAMIGVAVRGDTLDENAPTICLHSGGPAGKVLLRQRCRIRYIEDKKEIPILTGYLVVFNHDVAEDSLSAMVVCDKWCLDKVQIIGRCCAVPPNSSSGSWMYYYDPSPCIFNFRGEPDLLDTPNGVRFASEFRYGYGNRTSTSKYTEPLVGRATTQARSWRLADILSYLRSIYSGSYGSNVAPAQGDYEIGSISPYINWPENLGSDLDGFQRVKKDFELEGVTLLRGLERTCRAAGPFSIYLSGNTNFSSTMQVVNMNPKRSSGVRMKLPQKMSTNIATLAGEPNVILSGNISESIVNYSDEVIIHGMPPYFEFMASQWTDDPLNGGCLIPAWSDLDEVAFKYYVSTTTLGSDSKTAFERACEIYPHVYCAYKLFHPRIPWKDTKWPRAYHLSPPRIRPFILTSDIVENESNPNNFISKEIVIEYEENVETHTFRSAEPEDGLTLSPDRKTLYVPQLRKLGRTWKNSDTTNKYAGATMSANNIRINLAIEADLPLTGRAGANSNGEKDPVNTSHRIAQGEWFRYESAPVEGGYQEWLRHGTSRPNGTKCTEPYLTQNYPAQMTESNELFTDRVNATTGKLPEHAKKRLVDVKRLEYAGSFETSMFNPAVKPGLNIIIEGYGILPRAVCKSVTLDVNKGTCLVELAAHDSEQIYDLPVQLADNERTAQENDQSMDATNISKNREEQIESDKECLKRKELVGASRTVGTTTTTSQAVKGALKEDSLLNIMDNNQSGVHREKYKAEREAKLAEYQKQKALDEETE